ncbi:MAG TPA: Fe-Mn family superoxide dismutase [Candidatus Paceibacterota bacterium]
MHSYTAKKFNFPTLDGISEKQLEVHVALYGGYVKNLNTLQEQIADLEKDSEKYSFAVESLNRRFGFEFNGMRMHELYFSQWEGGGAVPTEGALGSVFAEQGGWDVLYARFKKVGMSRGPGWTTLVWDKETSASHVAWVADHELGTLTDVSVLLALDMWEHAYMVDYMPSEKEKYIDAFFKNLNWGVVEERFRSA